MNNYFNKFDDIDALKGFDDFKKDFSEDFDEDDSVEKEEKLILTLEDVNKILPKDLQLDESTRHHRNRYKTLKGDDTVLMSSKLISDKLRKQYWYCLNLDSETQTKMTHICLVCGTMGVCIIPTSDLDNVIKDCSWKILKKSNSYYIEVAIDPKGKVFVLRNKYDLTKYFIPFKE